MAETSKTSKTLFVGNLPFTATNEQLEQAYQEFGPIKSCFVVKNTQDAEGRCKGFGYVVFVVREDSEKAQKAQIKIGGRRVNAVFANPKDRKNKKNRPKTQEERILEIIDKELAKPKDGDVLTSPEANSKYKKKKREQDDSHKTLVLTGIKSEKHLKECTSDCKDAEVLYPVPDRDPGTALVKFAAKDAAHRALGKICKKSTKDKPISAVFMYKENWEARVKPAEKPKPNSTKRSNTGQKWCKLIVRNLSFKCKPEDLQKEANKYGETADVKIPLRSDGKMFGYGFVVYNNLQDAQEAMKEMNAKPILGRPVAVDWALARDKYKEVIKSTTPAKGKSEDSEGSDDDDDDSNQQAEEGSSDIGDEESSDDVVSGSEENEDVATSEEEAEEDDDSDEDNNASIEGDDDDDASDDDASSDEDNNSDEDDNSNEDNDSDEDDEDSDGSDDDEGFSSGDNREKKFKGKPSNDVNQGKTIFIRNVSFDTMNDDLEEYMGEFGEVKYCRIVIDPQTEHSKGVAFVQYVNKEDTDKVLKLAENEKEKPGGFVIDGRRLNITPAVSREEASKLRVKKEKDNDVKDKRNLWLLREGLIRPGTQAAQGLSKADLLKREQVERLKRKKLKNPDIFVSPTRLCVRNIPISCSDKQLRKVYLKAAQDKSAKIKECRIMRDIDRVSASGVGKSRGYGFIDFTDHKHALAALRQTNNNPELFGDKRRLIVEFSLESRSALKTKLERLERAQAKQEAMKQNAAGQKRTRQPRNKVKVNQVQAPPDGVDSKKIPRGMPSHMGPKVRHKPRQPVKPAKKPKDKAGRAAVQANKQKRKAENTPAEPSKKKRRGAPQRSDDLDKLVAKYKNALNTATLKKNSQKWFQS